jgi:hypothetical protein
VHAGITTAVLHTAAAGGGCITDGKVGKTRRLPVLLSLPDF